MTNERWAKTRQGSWMYTSQDPGRWSRDSAEIQCTAPQAWHLFVNRRYIATFNSWDEARDATPMMLTLHGYKEQS